MQNFTNYLRGSVDESLSLGTLAPLVVIGDNFDEVVEGRTRLSSIVAVYSLSNATPGAAIGPVLVGLAHSDYTDAEIEQWIETTGSWSRGDMVQTKEIAQRRIRKVGVFSSWVDGASAIVVLNDGKPIKTKLNWQLEEGQTAKLWAYNMGGVAFATTDPVVKAQGHANLWSL